MWKKLKRNKAAVAGMVIISLAVFVCIFGYLIAPDDTADADLQTVEITIPGARIYIDNF